MLRCAWGSSGDQWGCQVRERSPLFVHIPKRLQPPSHSISCRWNLIKRRAQSGTSSGPSNSAEDLSTSFANFCIIEGRDTVQDFARMQLAEIRDNIASRRNRIFLLMEEVSCACISHASVMALGPDARILTGLQVRRLRIQQRIKAREQNALTMGVEEEMPEYPSSIPFLPPLVSGIPITYDSCYSLPGRV